jgi:hypothetical protein
LLRGAMVDGSTTTPLLVLCSDISAITSFIIATRIAKALFRQLLQPTFMKT